MYRLGLAIILITPLAAQDLSGRWCAVSDAQDCVVLRQSGDALQGTFLIGATQVAEATGWSRGGQVAMGFRRLDNDQVATLNAVLDTSGRLVSRTLSADGRQRWSGIYARAGSRQDAPQCGIALELGIDRIASDYRTMGTGNPNACCVACEQDPKCRAFSWVSSQQTCYLKSNVPPATTAAGITSGNKGGPASNTLPPASNGDRCSIRLEDNTDLYASDMRTVGTGNAEACCVACGNDPKCRAFSWVSQQQTCYLKNAVPTRSVRQGIISGVK